MKKFIGGCLAGWIGTLVYYFLIYAVDQPEHTLGYFIANDFHQALPFIIGVPGVALGILLVYVLFTTFQHSEREILKKASKEGETVLLQAREKGALEVETIRVRAMVEANKIKADAQNEATELKREAFALKDGATAEWERIKDAWEQIDEVRQDLEEEYLRKKQSYKEEIEGLRAGRVRDKEITEVQEEIIRWQQEGNIGAADRAKDRLRGLRKRKGENPKDPKDDLP
jgi:myosin heavy subunit